MCEDARRLYQQRRWELPKQGGKLTPKQEKAVIQLVKDSYPNNPAQDAYYESSLPRKLAVAVSYLTLSRYGDIVLRSFAYDKQSYETFTSESDPTEPADRPQPAILFGYSSWRQWAVATELGLLVLMLGATIGVLSFQNRDRTRSRWSLRSTE